MKTFSQNYNTFILNSPFPLTLVAGLTFFVATACVYRRSWQSIGCIVAHWALALLQSYETIPNCAPTEALYQPDELHAIEIVEEPIAYSGSQCGNWAGKNAVVPPIIPCTRRRMMVWKDMEKGYNIDTLIAHEIVQNLTMGIIISQLQARNLVEWFAAFIGSFFFYCYSFSSIPFAHSLSWHDFGLEKESTMIKAYHASNVARSCCICVWIMKLMNEFINFHYITALIVHLDSTTGTRK